MFVGTFNTKTFKSSVSCHAFVQVDMSRYVSQLLRAHALNLLRQRFNFGACVQYIIS